MKNRLVINSIDRIDLINFDDLIYINSSGKYSTFITADNRKITSSNNLGSYIGELPTQQFVRVHNSYIVNLSFIQSIVKGEIWEILLTTGEKIPVSRRRKDDHLLIVLKTRLTFLLFLRNIDREFSRYYYFY